MGWLTVIALGAADEHLQEKRRRKRQHLGRALSKPPEGAPPTPGGVVVHELVADVELGSLTFEEWRKRDLG